MPQAREKKLSPPDPRQGPIVFATMSFRSMVAGISLILKSPKVLLTTLGISAVQVILSYLKIYMPSSFWLTMASFFTFAQGGMYAGLLGAVGGIIGKGVYAWFINSLLFSAAKQRHPKEHSQEKTQKEKQKVGLPLLGLGLALIVYNFLTGNGALENSIIGITAMVACMRVIGKKEGFLIGLISSFTRGQMTRGAAVSVVKVWLADFCWVSCPPSF